MGMSDVPAEASWLTQGYADPLSSVYLSRQHNETGQRSLMCIETFPVIHIAALSGQVETNRALRRLPFYGPAIKDTPL